MKNKSIFYLCLLLLPIFSHDGLAQTDYAKKPLTANGEYRIVQRVALKKASAGLAGRLEVLRDARLTWDVTFSQYRGDLPVIESGDEKVKEMFEKTPVRLAVVRAVDARGKVVDSKTLPCAEAEIKIVRLTKNAVPAYQVDCQYYGPSLAGGVVGSFAEIVGGRLRWLEALDRKTGKTTPIELLDETQETWKFARTATGRDILAVATSWYQDGDSSNAQLLYRRFHFDGRRWLVFERMRRDDYWDENMPFPKIARFPKAER